MSIKLYGNTSRRERERRSFADAPAERENIRPEGKRKSAWKKALIIAVAAIVLIAAGWTLLHKLFVKAPTIKNDGTKISVTSGSRKSDYLTFVLCGTDVGDLRTDTIMVAAYDIENKKINIVSVPRDTLINVSWNVKKINSAYALDGIEGLMEALKNLLGFEIDYYAVVNLNAFKEIVDAVGGVKFNVPEDMYYEDPDQNLVINLRAGEQTLNGDKAMQLIRYRSYAQADIKRISVQQQFIKALFAQTLKVGNIMKINELAGIFSKNMKTDLTTGNLLWLGERMLSVKPEDIATMTLPGTTGSYNGASYYLLKASEVLTIVNKYLNPWRKDIALSELDIVTLQNGYIVSSTGKKVKDTRRDSGYEEQTTPTPSNSPAPSGSPSPSQSPVPSGTPVPSGSPKPSPSAPVTPKPSPTPAPSASPKPTPAPSPSVKP